MLQQNVTMAATNKLMLHVNDADGDDDDTVTKPPPRAILHPHLLPKKIS